MPAVATLADLIADVAAHDGSRTAIIFGDQHLTYAQLDGAIDAVADALAAGGVGHGDRVALLLPNIPQFVVAYYGILRLGAIVVPLNVLYKTEEIRYILNDSEARVFVVFEGFYPYAAEAVKEAPSVEHVVVVGQDAQSFIPTGTTGWRALVDGSAPRRAPATVQPSDVAVICYTSGTTGRSKGAMLTHRNFVANCEQLAAIPGYDPRPDDRVLLVLPLFHIYAMNVGMNSALRTGATIVLIVRFEPVPVLEAIQRHRCTIFLGAPPMFVAWVNTPSLGDYDLTSLRIVNSGAAALPVEVLERFHETTGVYIKEGYGLTETAPVTHGNIAAPHPEPGTIGWTIPGVEARVVDENDDNVPIGAEGELLCRGENIMVGYWRNPAATAEALHGGWFHTGDIATVDAEGYYRIVDRKKDMINAGGFKVWPREVEEVLYRHPAVREAAVVAIPDDYAGERPLAYIALKDGQQATADELIAYCKSRLASFKAPVRVEFRPDLPKLPTGKVLRRVLRDEARELPPGETALPLMR